jgi:hypothetical protein
MSLSRILPSRAALDMRTFECGKCAHVEKVVVEADPMKSHVLGWLHGELRPPNWDISVTAIKKVKLNRARQIRRSFSSIADVLAWWWRWNTVE